MLQNIPRGRGPGTWQLVLMDEFGDNPHWSAIISCPECGRKLNCVNHSIAANGQISPSVGHPVEYPACSWHTTPLLLDWPSVFPPISVIPKSECQKCHRQSRSIGGWGIGWGYELICDICIQNIKKTNEIKK